jgi:hypothetical protein
VKTTVDESGRTTWHFSKQELVALLAVMSTDVTRPGISILVLDQKTGRCWATDGHRGAILKGERVDHDRAIERPVEGVKRETVESAIKHAAPKDEIRITGPGSASEIAKCRVEVMEPISPGSNFCRASYEAFLSDEAPNHLDAVVPERRDPKHKGGATACFNGPYLADLALVTKACPPTIIKRSDRGTDKLYPGVEIQPPASDLDPLLGTVRCPANGSEWSIVVMPMRM